MNAAKKREVQESEPTTWPGAFAKLLSSHWGICGLAAFMSFLSLTLVVLHLEGVIGRLDLPDPSRPAAAATLGDRP